MAIIMLTSISGDGWDVPAGKKTDRFSPDEEGRLVQSGQAVRAPSEPHARSRTPRREPR